MNEIKKNEAKKKETINHRKVEKALRILDAIETFETLNVSEIKEIMSRKEKLKMNQERHPDACFEVRINAKPVRFCLDKILCICLRDRKTCILAPDMTLTDQYNEPVESFASAIKASGYADLFFFHKSFILSLSFFVSSGHTDLSYKTLSTKLALLELKLSNQKLNGLRKSLIAYINTYVNVT